MKKLWMLCVSIGFGLLCGCAPMQPIETTLPQPIARGEMIDQHGAYLTWQYWGLYQGRTGQYWFAWQTDITQKTRDAFRAGGFSLDRWPTARVFSAHSIITCNGQWYFVLIQLKDGGKVLYQETRASGYDRVRPGTPPYKMMEESKICK